jgi:hypothetical protein
MTKVISPHRAEQPVLSSKINLDCDISQVFVRLALVKPASAF